MMFNKYFMMFNNVLCFGSRTMIDNRRIGDCMIENRRIGDCMIENRHIGDRTIENCPINDRVIANNQAILILC